MACNKKNKKSINIDPKAVTKPINGDYFSSSFSLSNSQLGAALLSLPFTISRIGWVASLILFVLAFFFLLNGYHAVISASYHTQARTLRDVLKYAFGPIMQIVFDIAIIFMYVGLLVSYINIASDYFRICIQSFFDTTFNVIYVKIVVGIIIFPTTCLKSTSVLGNISAFAIIFVAITSISVFVYYMITISNKGTVVQVNDDTYKIGLTDIKRLALPQTKFPDCLLEIVQRIPLFWPLFGCLPAIPPLMVDLHNIPVENKRSMHRAIASSMIMSGVFYLIVGISGSFMFGQYTASNILLNFSPKEIWMTVVRLLYGIVILLSYPLLFLPVRTTILRWFKTTQETRKGNIIFYVSAVIAVIITTIVAIALPDIVSIFNIISSFFGIIVYFVVPILLSWKRPVLSAFSKELPEHLQIAVMVEKLTIKLAKQKKDLEKKSNVKETIEGRNSISIATSGNETRDRKKSIKEAREEVLKIIHRPDSTSVSALAILGIPTRTSRVLSNVGRKSIVLNRNGDVEVVTNNEMKRRMSMKVNQPDLEIETKNLTDGTYINGITNILQQSQRLIEKEKKENYDKSQDSPLNDESEILDVSKEESNNNDILKSDAMENKEKTDFYSEYSYSDNNNEIDKNEKILLTENETEKDKSIKVDEKVKKKKSILAKNLETKVKEIEENIEIDVKDIPMDLQVTIQKMIEERESIKIKKNPKKYKQRYDVSEIEDDFMSLKSNTMKKYIDPLCNYAILTENGRPPITFNKNVKSTCCFSKDMLDPAYTMSYDMMNMNIIQEVEINSRKMSENMIDETVMNAVMLSDAATMTINEANGEQIININADNRNQPSFQNNERRSLLQYVRNSISTNVNSYGDGVNIITNTRASIAGERKNEISEFAKSVERRLSNAITNNLTRNRVSLSGTMMNSTKKIIPINQLNIDGRLSSDLIGITNLPVIKDSEEDSKNKEEMDYIHNRELLLLKRAEKKRQWAANKMTKTRFIGTMIAIVLVCAINLFAFVLSTFFDQSKQHPQPSPDNEQKVTDIIKEIFLN